MTNRKKYSTGILTKLAYQGLYLSPCQNCDSLSQFWLAIIETPFKAVENLDY